MASRKLIYYVTGHGYGHAGRAANVIQSLVTRRPDVSVYVRTTAPQRLFADLGPQVHFEATAIDRGAIERDSLRIDWEATLATLAEFLSREAATIAREVAFIRSEGISLIAADVPYVAGYIAEAAGIPCLAVGNFTWDWIYEPHLQADARYPGLLEHMRGGYARMRCMLRLPFAHPMSLFPRVVDVPLVAKPHPRPADDVLRRLGIAANDYRPRILLGMRDPIDPGSLQAAARSSSELLFLCPGPVEPDRGENPIAENVRPVRWSPLLSFWDTLNVCRAVISKLGYGIVADCVASRVALLWPARNDFREDAMLAEASEQYFCQREISLQDFHSGRWGRALRQLLALPPRTLTLPINGADVCADLMYQFFGA
jgi:hypothetical protein